MKKPSFSIALLLICVLTSNLHAALYSGGSGTEADPYQIADVNDLLELSTDSNNYDKCFILMADIDLDGQTFTTAVLSPDPDSTTGGFQGTEFKGMFDGNNYTIRNLTIEATGNSYIGFFGYIGSSGHIKNLGLVDMNITGATYVGSLCGYSAGGTISQSFATGVVTGIGSNIGGLCGFGGTINDSYVTGTVTGGSSVGGLVGAWGTSTNCHSSGTIIGTNGIGGIVGWGGNIIGCYSTSNVSGSYYVGGINGFNNSGIISRCFSTGSIKANHTVGGLMGWNFGAYISNCYSVSTVSGSGKIGGLVGSNHGQIENCYSRGAVSGASDSQYVGGFVGYNEDSISNCYSTGYVSGGYQTVGGFIGEDAGDGVSSGFWDTQTSHRATSSGGAEGKTTTQMKTLSTFTSAGFDFINEIAKGTCNYWMMPESGGYPELAIFNGIVPREPAGSGTKESPYIIMDANDLGTIWYRYSAYYVLANNIDLTGTQWSMAVVPRFSGFIDGQGFCIRNLRIFGGDNIGLFGTSTGQIEDVNVEDFYISSYSYSNAGGLVGGNGGKIYGCCSTGTIRGIYKRRYVGGLAGSSGGNISHCYSSVLINSSTQSLSSYDVGGLVGYNSGNISVSVSNSTINCFASSQYTGGLVGRNSGGNINNCYASGIVNGMSNVGGLVGSNSGTLFPGSISNCYSNGIVSGTSSIGGLVGYNTNSVTNSFWDTDISGQTTSAGGVGKTSTEMQTLSIFTDAGWDFINETANGTCNYWGMPEGNGYPILSIFNGYIPTELSGSGTVEDPYIIADANDLGTIWYRPSAYYALANNIDLTGIHWTLSVIPIFYGVLDGNGFCLENLDMNGGGFLGLIGRMDSRSIVQHLALEDCNIIGFSSIGGLVGYNRYGKINQCYITGMVSGESNIAGIAGYNDSVTGISDSYSTAIINGVDYVGGLVGRNTPNGLINNCYSINTVDGSSYVGGLVGYSERNVVSSFWDTEISRQTTSDGGVGVQGKTTVEMKTPSTFTDVGWNFANIWAICEGTNYPRLRWQIPAGDWACPDGVNVEDLDVLSSCWLETVQAKSDINDDDMVNFEDLVRLSQNWLSTICGTCNDADITDDGNVNELDLSLMTDQWLFLENVGCRMTDLNTDGKVDLADWSVFAENWLLGV